MSRRTQVTFTDGQHAFLIDESWRSGLPMAELVRRAVDNEYKLAKRRSLRGYALSAGIWHEADAALIGRRPRWRRPQLD